MILILLLNIINVIIITMCVIIIKYYSIIIDVSINTEIYDQ